MAKPKRCHYDVLGVSRDATADEIRCSFRQLALQIHPDKQAASCLSTADATVAFQELFEAYKVLSDTKERDWYDTHRSNPRSETRSSHLSRASILDLSIFFTSSCFSGYSDSGKGFFKVYGEVFSEIYSQELYFARNLGLGLDPAPPIGNVYSPYAQFMAFYNYWLGFSTVIDFNWIDDEEDKEEARNSRNWMVRDLAAFARKMDKRLVDLRGRESEEDEKLREKARAKKEEKAKRRKDENLKFGNLNMNKIPQNQEDNDDDDDDEVVHEMMKGCKKEKKKKKKENVTDKMKKRAKRKAKRMEKKMEKEETMKKFQSVCNEIDEDDEKKKSKFWLMKMKKKNNNNNKRNNKVMYEGVEDDIGDDDMVVEEEKKEKGFGRVYCMECKKYFRFHEHIKNKGSSKKVVGRDKWDASKPLILVFQNVVEATPRKSYQYRFFNKYRR